MRFARGVVKIPVKLLYVFLVAISTAFVLYIYILNYQRIRVQGGQCRVTPEPREPPETKGAHVRSQQNHSACWRAPEVTQFEECPHCFRPNVKNIYGQLYQVQYSTSIFPRGPPNLFKPRNEIQQDLITDYLITPSAVCVDTCPYLVVILLSISDQVDQRTAIRATWASAAKTRLWPYAIMNADIQVVFVLAHQTSQSYFSLGEPQVPKKYIDKENFPTLREWTRIKRESDQFGDILYLNMQDSYYNLTLKLVSAFKWVAEHCPKTKFFLKVDTDTFVNIPLLLDLLIFSENRLEYSVLGKMYIYERTVRRANKWAVNPEVYPPAIFPVYASDCAYVASSRLLPRIVDITPYMPLAQIINMLNSNQTNLRNQYITGVLGTVLSFDYFTGPNTFFTDTEDKGWYWCDMLHDWKIIGKVVDNTALYKMWRSFFRYYGKCWKEIPELANPKA